jgi:hypothetical protein
MKCLSYHDSGKIVRVSNEEAAMKVSSGRAYYTSKSAWRAQLALEEGKK